MQSHAKNVAATTHVKAKWDDTGTFNTQVDYIEHLRSLPHNELRKVAKDGQVIAQRILASYYQDKNENKKSTFWWKKALENKDPIALLHQSSVHIASDEFQQAKSLCDQALTEIKSCQDQEFIEVVKDIATGNRIVIATNLTKLGVQKLETKDTDSAMHLFKQAEELGDACAAYNIAHLLQENDKDSAIFHLKVALYLSHNFVDPSSFRADTHNLFAKILAKQLPEKCSYGDLLQVVTHIRKAIAYSNDDGTYKKNLKLFMKSIKDAEIKKSLLKDTTTLQYQNKIVKTVHETLSHPNMDDKQTKKFLKYQDPRKDTVKQAEAAKTHSHGMFAINTKEHSENTGEVKELSLDASHHQSAAGVKKK